MTSGLNTPREWRTKIIIFPVAFSSWPVVENHQPLSYQSTWIIAKSRAFINVGKTVFEQLKTNQPEHSWIAKRNPPKMPARFSPSSGFPLGEINKIIFSKARYFKGTTFHRCCRGIQWASHKKPPPSHSGFSDFPPFLHVAFYWDLLQ